MIKSIKMIRPSNYKTKSIPSAFTNPLANTACTFWQLNTPWRPTPKKPLPCHLKQSKRKIVHLNAIRVPE